MNKYSLKDKILNAYIFVIFKQIYYISMKHIDYLKNKLLIED